MRRAQIGVNKDHRMGQHHVAAASRQRPPVLGGTDNLARLRAFSAGKIIPSIAKGTAHRPGVAGNAEAREGTLQHSAQRMIDRFGGFAERLLHRPGEAKVDNARPLGHQTAAGAAKPYRPAARGKMRADRRQIRKLTIAPRHHQSLRRLPELGDGLAGAGFGKQRLFGLGGILAKLQRQRGGGKTARPAVGQG